MAPCAGDASKGFAAPVASMPTPQPADAASTFPPPAVVEQRDGLDRAPHETARGVDLWRFVKKLQTGRTLSEDEWTALIEGRTPDLADRLFAQARAARDEAYGRAVYLRGLIELTNFCKNDCLYCGIRKSNRQARRYRMSVDEVLACCTQGYAQGLRTFVLQGGEDPWFAQDKIVAMVRSIRRQHPDCAITLSLGEWPHDAYAAFRAAGADRFLLRHETADDGHYAMLHPTSMSPDRRKTCLFDLRRLGYQVGSGFMVGSPGQTARHLARDLAFLKELNPHMIGIGPFVPHRHTAFRDEPAGSADLTLFLIGCLRLMLPRALIPATTALNSVDAQGRMRGLAAGANVLMPNLTPPQYRGSYDLYNGKATSGLEGVENIARLRRQLEEAGYQVPLARGDSAVAVERA
ncbi:[FeFe] hydrogenase H-cluster radical SAM maturase HydE [Xiamenia xianingshaonis]|nr:[FeFe] hydrogenase H-cluster radical SAM maturase HydE [Xiamenia xianingshaonis]